MEKIKIAFITYSLAGGGTEKRIINLAGCLLKENMEIDMISFKKNNDYKKEYKEVFQGLNTIHLSSYKQKIPRILLLFIMMFILLKSILLAYKRKYSLLFGFDYFSWYLIYLIRKLRRTKNVIVVGNNLSREIAQYNFVLQFFHNKFLKLVFNDADKIISISKGVAYNLEASFAVPKDKIEVIYNGVNIEKIKRSIRKTKFNKYNNIIITCGRLEEQKGHIYLIRAFSLINKLAPHLKLVILGKGPLKNKLEKLIIDLNLQDKIILVGFKDKPELYMEKASVFVLPSLFEGFANVLVEAMACGLPVISTNCDYGPRELIYTEDVKYPYKPISKVEFCKYGILVPPSSEQHLTDAIFKIINDNKLISKYKRASLQRAQDFCLERMSNRYYSVIKDLIRFD